MKRTALKRKTPLKAHKRLNPVSPKQAALNEEWNEITNEKVKKLDYLCQWCHKPGQRDDKYHIFPPNGYLDGHHTRKPRSSHNEKKYCYVCHRLCHFFIDTHNIDVSVYPDEEAWVNREKEVSRDEIK
jgi:hypothetical protein